MLAEWQTLPEHREAGNGQAETGKDRETRRIPCSISRSGFSQGRLDQVRLTCRLAAGSSETNGQDALNTVACNRI